MFVMTDEKTNTLLLEYAGKGLTSGVLMVLQAGADANHKDRYGKGALDCTKEIKDERADEEKRAAVLALMAEYSVLCAVATGKGDLVAVAVAKGCNMNETDQAGNTAVEWAQNAQTIEVLKAAGATMHKISD